MFIKVAGILLLFSVSQMTASEWPQFRGPERNGLLEENSGFHFSENAKLELLWKKPSGKGGYSEIVSNGKYLFTMTSDGKDDFALCLLAETGKEIWRRQIAKTLYLRGNADPGPLSTPTINGDLVFVLSAEGLLYALSSKTGEVNWKTDLIGDFGGKRPFHGYATSPLVHEQKVIVQTGGPEKSIVALDRNTGKLLWDVHPEPPTFSTTNYASPGLLLENKQTQVLFKTVNYLSAANLGTGKLVWQIRNEENPFATPLVRNGNQIFVAGMNHGTLLELKEGKASTVWKSTSLKRNYSEPVWVGEHFYGFNSTFLTCVDGKTGRCERWKSREPGDGWISAVGQYLLLVSEKGSLHLAKASPDAYQEIDSIQVLDGRTLTHASAANGRIFVRNLTQIACVIAR